MGLHGPPESGELLRLVEMCVACVGVPKAAPRRPAPTGRLLRLICRSCTTSMAYLGRKLGIKNCHLICCLAQLLGSSWWRAPADRSGWQHAW